MAKPLTLTAEQVRVIEAADDLARTRGDWVETEHTNAFDYHDGTVRVWRNPRFGYLTVWTLDEDAPVLRYDSGDVFVYQPGPWEAHVLAVANGETRALAGVA